MDRSETYQAARTGAGLVDLSARGRLVVLGSDRASYLHGLLANDIEALTPGSGCYAVYLTPQGRIVADMQVRALDDGLLLDLHPSVTEMLAARLREFVFTEEVRVEDRTGVWTSLAVHGPRAPALLEGLLEPVGEDRAGRLGTLDERRHVIRHHDGVPVVVAGTRDLGAVGLTIYADRAAGAGLTDALLDAGAVTLDPATQEILRVEAGRPAFPADLGPDVIPLEAGIEDRAISMTKGCYVGQEVIVRILHRGGGRVARRLVGLRFDGESPPAAGTELVEERDGGPGVVVGTVTSSVWSPSLSCPIGLGYVKRELVEPGTRLLTSGGAGVSTVAGLPFR